MLVVGYGKLGQAIVSALHDHGVEEVKVYNRTVSKAAEVAGVAVVKPEQFSHENQVIIALPAHAYEPFFLKYAKAFPEDCQFFYTATNLEFNDVSALLTKQQRAISVKLLGHAYTLERAGTFVVLTEEDRRLFSSVTSGAFSTIVGTESSVRMANTIVTTETLRAIISIEQQLKAKHFDEQMIERAIKSMIPGIVDAHITDTHGGFARSIMERWENENDGK